jgi:hypothetical protein
MRIAVSRTGGLAGIPRRGELETTGRPDATHLHALAGSVLAAGHATPPGGVPDGFAYAITVDGRTVYCADPDLCEAQRELVQTVLKEGA